MNQNHPPVPMPEVARDDTETTYAPDIDRREQLRAEELEHLTELRDRIERGIDDGRIDLYGGTQMLLNISKARMALSGVDMYPRAW